MFNRTRDMLDQSTLNSAWSVWKSPLSRTIECQPGSERQAALLRQATDDSPEIQVLGPVSRVRTPAMARLEAVLVVANVALPARKLAQLASLADATEVRTLVQQLNLVYDQCGTAFRVERVAAGFRLFTRPEFAMWLGKLHHREAELKLSPPALETLTVIAYRQPMTRADVEAIRGVQCSEILKQLMDRGLIRIAGEDDSLGRPFLYETTRKFLEVFGLRELDDLPLSEKLRRVPDSAAEPLKKAG